MEWLEPCSSQIDWKDGWRKVEFYTEDGTLHTGNLSIDAFFDGEDEFPFPSFDVDGVEYSFFECTCWRFVE
jgi:hypothetical protein